MTFCCCRELKILLTRSLQRHLQRQKKAVSEHRLIGWPTGVVETPGRAGVLVVLLRYGACEQTRTREINADNRALIEDNGEIDGGTGCIRGRNNEDHGAAKHSLDYEIACVCVCVCGGCVCDGQKEHEVLLSVVAVL